MEQFQEGPKPPKKEVPTSISQENMSYVGFWVRFLAAIIDSIVFIVLSIPLYFFFTGGLSAMADPTLEQDAITQLLYFIAVIALWVKFSATPGKMLFKAVIVDKRTLGKPSVGQLIGRYFSYFISVIPLCLGIFWIAFDPKKRGWHDLLAGTLVVYEDRD